MKLVILLAVASSFAFGLEDPRYQLPSGGETYAQSYDKYAKKILQDGYPANEEVRKILLPKLTLDWGLAEEDYDRFFLSMKKAQYSITFPASEKCNAGIEGRSSRSAYRDLVVKQIDEAAAFLADYHARMMARNHSLFKIRNIEICAVTLGYGDNRYIFDRFLSKLTIRTGPVHAAIIESNFHVQDRDTLKQNWNDGEHWRKEGLKEFIDANKNPVRAHWRVLNPIGETRVLLREAMVKVVTKVASTIRALRTEGSPLEWRALILNTMGTALTADQEKRIEELKDGDLNSVLAAWEKKITNPDTEGSMTLATMGAVLQKRMEKQQKIGITRTQKGFINIENFHKIDVSFMTGDAKDFQEFIAVPETIDVNVDQVGFINVSTTDVVDVKVALAALAPAVSSVYPKTTLKSVLKELRLLK